MDPVSRRDLWEVISKMVVADNNPGHRCSVILTTHSMEECEALCPRIGIMAGGKLKCIGSGKYIYLELFIIPKVLLRSVKILFLSLILLKRVDSFFSNSSKAQESFWTRFSS